MGSVHAPQTRPRRIAFAAELRATDTDSGREIWGETANLSKGGCYVRAIRSFPEGTFLSIEIKHHTVRFKTDARVAYCVQEEGMGLAFLNIPASQLPILQNWLSSAAFSE